MSGLAAAIADVYRQVAAPDWARPNLDGLADVLRDLSWLPEGPVRVRAPGSLSAAPADGRRLEQVLVRAAAETAGGPHPVQLM